MRWQADTVAVSSTAWMLASTQWAGLVSWAPVSWSVIVTSHSGRPSYDVPYCSTVDETRVGVRDGVQPRRQLVVAEVAIEAVLGASSWATNLTRVPSGHDRDARHPPPRAIDVEPREPVHRLARRPAHADRRGGGVGGRTHDGGGRAAVRRVAHVGADPGGDDAPSGVVGDGPGVAAGAAALAVERAPLRRPAGARQEGDDGVARCGADAPVAAELRRSTAARADRQPGTPDQRSPLPTASRPTCCRRASACATWSPGCCRTGTTWSRRSCSPAWTS